jgi:hypothetical protein
MDDTICNFCGTEVVDPANDLTLIESGDVGEEFIAICHNCLEAEAEQQGVSPMEASLTDMLSQIKHPEEEL